MVHPDTYDKESPYISSSHIMKGTVYCTLDNNCDFVNMYNVYQRMLSKTLFTF